MIKLVDLIENVGLFIISARKIQNQNQKKKKKNDYKKFKIDENISLECFFFLLHFMASYFFYCKKLWA